MYQASDMNKPVKIYSVKMEKVEHPEQSPLHLVHLMLDEEKYYKYSNLSLHLANVHPHDPITDEGSKRANRMFYGIAKMMGYELPSSFDAATEEEIMIALEIFEQTPLPYDVDYTEYNEMYDDDYNYFDGDCI